jgi:predicted TIM-barrel fold metal-dependent hydrolase
MQDVAGGLGWDSHVHVFDAQAPVMPGHYRPVDRPLTDIEQLAGHHGVAHLVLVQPSVYGCDNTVMLDALRQGDGRHRGVAVLEPGTTDAQLASMHSLGVRGVRFNLVSPVGNDRDIGAHFRALAPRIQAMGWHVQWYAQPAHWPRIADLHAGCEVTAVLDHLAGANADTPLSSESRQALARLAQGGAWLKLSGWYRLAAQAPYDALDARIGELAGLFPARTVWGSDWPHTSFAPDALPDYSSVWEPVARVFDTAQQVEIMRISPEVLYG